jgi:hypothetical protein
MVTSSPITCGMTASLTGRYHGPGRQCLPPGTRAHVTGQVDAPLLEWVSDWQAFLARGKERIRPPGLL